MTIVNKNYRLELEEPGEDDLMLRVALERPEPQAVKLSRKNVALITITPEDAVDDSFNQAKLIEFFMSE